MPAVIGDALDFVEDPPLGARAILVVDAPTAVLLGHDEPEGEFAVIAEIVDDWECPGCSGCRDCLEEIPS